MHSYPISRLTTPQKTHGYHVATQQDFVPPQPPSQPNNQVAPLRMPPAGPPTQSSTPPNSDLKVQSMTQQQWMNIAYVPQTTRGPPSQNFYRPQQTTQNPFAFLNQAPTSPTCIRNTPSGLHLTYTDVKVTSGNDSRLTSSRKLDLDVDQETQNGPYHILHQLEKQLCLLRVRHDSITSGQFCYSKLRNFQKSIDQLDKLVKSFDLIVKENETLNKRVAELEMQVIDVDGHQFSKIKHKNVENIIKQKGHQCNNNEAKPKVNRDTICLTEEVKLRKFKNAWKPTRIVEDEQKTKDLYKKVRSVLNKLTPQKYNTLLEQIKNFSIDTAERLQGFTDLVFEKAVDEPNFSVAYATLCGHLALLQVPTGSGNKKDGQEFVNFRKLLITRCQLEFEKNSVDESERNVKLKEIEECTDVEKKKDLLLDLEDYDRRIRMKFVGIIQFIGELYKQNMLTANIMMRCLNNLLKTNDEESLECLCKLLTTVGKELESKGENLTTLFNPMKEISDRKHGKISSRVRFIIQDVIDLRNSKWVPRRQGLEPKTMDQIQNAVVTDHLSIQHYNRQPSEDKIIRLSKCIIEEYLNGVGLRETDEKMKNSIPTEKLPQIVYTGYMLVLERFYSVRNKTGSLFAYLIKSGTLPLWDYVTGLKNVLAEVQELIIDIPYAWEYVAELVVPLVCENAFTFHDLCNCLFSIIKNDHTPKFLASLCNLIIKEKGLNFLQSSWKSSQQKFSDYMQESKVDAFLKQNSFEFMIRNSQLNPNHSSLSYDEIHDKLLSFFHEKTPSDDVVNWINANIGESKMGNQFIRTLTTAILNYAVVNKKLKSESFVKKYIYLNTFCNNITQYQLQCLYALQKFLHKLEYPEGLLLQIFSKLYESNVISKKSFLSWKLCNAPAEQEGKCKALKELSSFFIQLKEFDKDLSENDEHSSEEDENLSEEAKDSSELEGNSSGVDENSSEVDESSSEVDEDLSEVDKDLSEEVKDSSELEENSSEVDENLSVVDENSSEVDENLLEVDEHSSEVK